MSDKKNKDVDPEILHEFKDYIVSLTTNPWDVEALEEHALKCIAYNTQDWIDFQAKPTIVKKAERQSSWSPRTYFIVDNNTENTDLKFADGCIFKSEDDAKQFIVTNGALDTPYFIGYKVTSVKPVTKTAKIKLT